MFVHILIRCTLATLEEGLSVRPSVGHVFVKIKENRYLRKYDGGGFVILLDTSSLLRVGPSIGQSVSQSVHRSVYHVFLKINENRTFSTMRSWRKPCNASHSFGVTKKKKILFIFFRVFELNTRSGFLLVSAFHSKPYICSVKIQFHRYRAGGIRPIVIFPELGLKIK